MKKITLSNLRAKKGARNHKLKTRGRGPGSGSIRGFKGNKGQGQRITGSVRAGFEGGQTPLYRRVRIIGFNNYEFANNYNVITLNMILKNKKNDFKNELNPTTLLPLIRNKKWPIKIIGDQKTKITQAYKVKVHKISQGAKKAIEAAGGSIELIKQEIKNKVKDKQTKKIQKVKK